MFLPIVFNVGLRKPPLLAVHLPRQLRLSRDVWPDDFDGKWQLSVLVLMGSQMSGELPEVIGIERWYAEHELSVPVNKCYLDINTYLSAIVIVSTDLYRDHSQVENPVTHCSQDCSAPTSIAYIGYN